MKQNEFADDSRSKQNELQADFQKNYNQSISADQFFLAGTQVSLHKTSLRAVNRGLVLLNGKENADGFVMLALTNIFRL